MNPSSQLAYKSIRWTWTVLVIYRLKHRLISLYPLMSPSQTAALADLCLIYRQSLTAATVQVKGNYLKINKFISRRNDSSHAPTAVPPTDHCKITVLVIKNRNAHKKRQGMDRRHHRAPSVMPIIPQTMVLLFLIRGRDSV